MDGKTKGTTQKGKGDGAPTAVKGKGKGEETDGLQELLEAELDKMEQEQGETPAPSDVPETPQQDETPAALAQAPLSTPSLPPTTTPPTPAATQLDTPARTEEGSAWGKGQEATPSEWRGYGWDGYDSWKMTMHSGRIGHRSGGGLAAGILQKG